jgi:hypothetical protein
VRLEQVLPASYPNNWRPTPDAIGLRGDNESLVYLVAPGVSFPANATTTNLPVQHATALTLTNWPGGPFITEWYAPATGARLGRMQASTTNGDLIIALPDYTEDLIAVIFPPPILTAVGLSTNNAFELRLNSELGGRYFIQASLNLLDWATVLTVTNTTGNILIAVPVDGTNAFSFYRAQKIN